ncbi:carbon-nitrogen hydrolase [Physcia stellaris]|nr:carbon-nitrogen hydrolase [Physcia stellaris]
MAGNIQELAQLLRASLNPTTNKQGQSELVLRNKEAQPGFSILLLHIVADPSLKDTHLASALYFKNLVRRRWTDQEGNYGLSWEEVVTIKKELIGLMTSVPPNIQSQLGEAIGIIAESDFYEKWDTLVDPSKDLVSRLSPNDVVVNNGVLQVAHSIFKRWRPLMRSDELFTEINHVLTKFGGPFLVQLQNTHSLIQEQSSAAQGQLDKRQFIQIFTTLNLLMKLFYDLSSQDLPPIFEDNLQTITTLFQTYLTYDNALLHTTDDTEAGPLELVKSAIFEILTLYVQKYDEDFASFVGQFIESSWNFLTTVGPETKYDIVVSKALHFLTSVTRIQKHAEVFKDENTTSQVIQKAILPNLVLRDSDAELFEDEPIEFIRRDLEGSDSETRRRAAADFLSQLVAQFDQLVATIVFRYIDHYQSDYKRDPKANWKSKDTAINLFISIAVKGTVTTSQGAITTYPFANIIDFFEKNIAHDFLSDAGVEPILKVGSIKYLYLFRSQISQQQWQSVFPILVEHLMSPDYVVYSYSAMCLERVMALRNSNNEPVISQSTVQEQSARLLEQLFRLIEIKPDAAKLQENEFLMRCVMRVLVVIREGSLPIINQVLPRLIKITQVICQNPSNPRFDYYHFEAVGALIRYAAPSAPQVFENQLNSAFAGILVNDISEFIPYVFQLLAALLEADSSTALPSFYQSLLDPTLNPGLWAMRGNVPALVRFLSAVIPRGATEIIANNQLETLLGIFQRLISTKTNEVYAFEILESVLLTFSASVVQPYFQTILQLLLTRLQNAPSEAFTQRFVRLYHLISSRVEAGMGADFFDGACEQLQAGVFVPIYLKIILPTTGILTRPIDRKSAVVSFVSTLVTSNAFAQKYKKGWAFTAEALLKLLEIPPVAAATSDNIVEQDVDDMSFGVGFTPLNTVTKSPRDPYPEITDVKAWVRQQMVKNGSKVSVFAQERLSPEARPIFIGYMQG